MFYFHDLHGKAKLTIYSPSEGIYNSAQLTSIIRLKCIFFSVLEVLEELEQTIIPAYGTVPGQQALNLPQWVGSGSPDNAFAAL